MGFIYQLCRPVLRPPRGDQHGKHTRALINGTHHRCLLRRISPLPGLLCGPQPPRDSGGRDRAPCLALVHSGCYNNTPQTGVGGPYKHQKFTSPTSGGWKPKIRGRPGWVLGKVFCAADCSLSLGPHMVGGARALSSIRTGPLSSPLEGPGTGQTGLVPTGIRTIRSMETEKKNPKPCFLLPPPATVLESAGHISLKGEAWKTKCWRRLSREDATTG